MKPLDPKSAAVGALLGGVLLLALDVFYLKSIGAIKAFFLGAALGFAVQGGERLTGAS